MTEVFAEIALFSALDKTLHYLVPSNLKEQVRIGVRVLAPLGKRQALGVVVKLDPAPPDLSEEILFRPLLAVLDQAPIIPEDMLALCTWISKYYFYPLGEILQLALPANVRSAPGTYFRLAASAGEAIKDLSDSELLALLSRKAELSLKLLKRRLESDRNLQEELGKLERDGIIERVFRFDSTTTPTSKRTKHLRLRLVAYPDAEIRKNQKLADLMNLLEELGGIAPMSLLRERLKNAGYWIQKLVKMGCVEIEGQQEAAAIPYEQPSPGAGPPVPSLDQQSVLDVVQRQFTEPSFKTFLVFGVTGSGKSEIYLRLVETALRHQKGALILVPEIALTFQLESLFRQRFGSQLAIWHSGLSGQVREEQWRHVVTGARKVVLGARSAIFMPVAHLGLIVIDEEHDSSYKQDDHLRYQARDVALMRAQMLGIPIVLGSATPSLQSMYHSLNNRYTLLSLPRRIHDRPLPDLEIIDMRKENKRNRILSGTLKEALAETLQAGQQALLFLNRRGFATFVLCNVCGQVLQCENCSVSLTYHQKKESLCCHYCGSEKKLPEHCPVCDHKALILHGFGTERIEKEVKKHFPGAQVVRIDRDTVSGPRFIAECLESVREHRANVLIGTQMLTKGHDFPNITLVGVINADTGLQIADFRAGETTVQLLIQVAGRAGRGDKPGRVILQTYNPSHYTIESVLNMDYHGFCRKELASRERLQYPPFARLLRFLVTSGREELTRHAASELAHLCREAASEFRSQAKYLAILGPSPAPLVKLKNRFRWHIYAKAWTNKDLQEFTETVLERSNTHPVLRRVQLAIDRDPTMVN
jgi:primosomal protein N' (replication factor Y) (superfamily II helicase)